MSCAIVGGSRATALDLDHAFWKPARPVVVVAGEQAHALAVALEDQAVAAVFYFVA
jgi:hypothetical protein